MTTVRYREALNQALREAEGDQPDRRPEDVH